jgi:tetratricopeptide (TPR) repeat protein
MKWTTWILFAASLGLLLAVGVMVSRQANRSAGEQFSAIQKRIAQGNYDRERTIANLDQVLARAQSERLTELQSDIRLARGKLLMQVGAFDRARNDLMIVLDGGQGGRGVERLLVELEERAGDYRAGLARLSKMLEADSTHAEDWVMKGELCRQAGEKTLSTEKQTVAKVLAPESAAIATPLLELAAALDPTDAKRVAVEHDLRGLFGFALEREGEEALVAADATSRDFATAREALSRSFVLKFDARPFATLVELLRRAGHNTEAVDLCTAGLRIPAVRGDARVTKVLVDAVTDLDRPKFAGTVTAQWITRDQAMSAEFYLGCCRVMYRAEE